MDLEEKVKLEKELKHYHDIIQNFNRDMVFLVSTGTFGAFISSDIKEPIAEALLKMPLYVSLIRAISYPFYVRKERAIREKLYGEDQF